MARKRKNNVTQTAQTPNPDFKILGQRNVPLATIIANPNQNARKNLGDIKELRSSIEQQGLINPLTVIQDGESYEVIAGFRRHAALKEIHEATGSFATVPVTLVEGSERELAFANLAENFGREDLRFVDLAHMFAKIKKEHGYKNTELAQKLGMSEQSVGKYLNILDPEKLSPRIVARCEELSYDLLPPFRLLSNVLMVGAYLKIEDIDERHAAQEEAFDQWVENANVSKSSKGKKKEKGEGEKEASDEETEAETQKRAKKALNKAETFLAQLRELEAPTPETEAMAEVLAWVTNEEGAKKPKLPKPPKKAGKKKK